MTRRIYFLFLAFSLVAVSAWSVPKDDYMRLARLSYLEGNVSYQHTADVDWSAASVNLPLEPGDRIYTGHDGRAEIEFEDGSIYRLARNTDIEVLSLKEERIQMRILVGLATLIVNSDTDYEIDTPVAAFTALRKGTYRFGVGENGDSDAIVRKGELEAANNHFSRRIQAGEMVQVAMNGPDKPEYTSYDKRDEWDEWNDRRNADMNSYAGRRYVPDTVYIGVSDLHRHGRWINVESYGLAWAPFGVSISWAPYSTGRWCYRPFYGWTWVSYEPWGWLPYHYGRWYRSSRYGWCWLPGPAFAFNFWSPALVTFYRGPGWISWCPLGPGDYYNINRYHYNRGIYGRHLAQLRNLHTRAPDNPFHRGNRDAFRTVDTDHFRNGSFGDRGGQARLRNIDQPWRDGERVRDRMPVEPTKASFRPAPDRQASGPENNVRGLPTVVRNIPGENLRGQEQFRRITNPEIPSLPARAERRLTEQQRGPARASESTPNARTPETPTGYRATAGATNLQRTESVDQNGQRTTTYRWIGTAENNRESTRSGEGIAPAPRPENNAGQGNSAGVRTEDPVRAQKKAQTPPTRVTPRIEEYHRPNSFVEQRSNVTERSNGSSSGSSGAPRTEGYRTFSTPQPERAPSNGAPRIESAPSYAAPRADRVPGMAAPQTEGHRTFSTPRPESVPSNGAPRVESAPSYAAPRVDRAPGNTVPRQSAPSVDRDSGPRTYATPSQSKGGGSPAGPSSAGRSGGNSSSGQSGGGGARTRDK